METPLGERGGLVAPDKSTGSEELQHLIRPLDHPQNYRKFSDAGFCGVDVESQLGEMDVSSRQTRVPVRKGHNF